MLMLAYLNSSQYYLGMAHVRFEIGGNEQAPSLRLAIPRHLADAAMARWPQLKDELWDLEHRDALTYETIPGERGKRLTVVNAGIGAIEDWERKDRTIRAVNTAISQLAIRKTQRRGPEPPLELLRLYPDGMFGIEAILSAKLLIPHLDSYIELQQKVTEVMKAIARQLGMFSPDQDYLYDNIDAFVSRQNGVFLAAPSSMNTDLNDYNSEDRRVMINDNNVGFNEEVIVHLAGLAAIAQANDLA